MAASATLSGNCVALSSLSPMGKLRRWGGIMHSRMESIRELCGRAEAKGEDASPPAAHRGRPGVERRLADNDKMAGLLGRRPHVTCTCCRPIRESALHHNSNRCSPTRSMRQASAEPSPRLHRRSRPAEPCLSTLRRAATPVMSHFHGLFIDRPGGAPRLPPR